MKRILEAYKANKTLSRKGIPEEQRAKMILGPDGTVEKLRRQINYEFTSLAPVSKSSIKTEIIKDFGE